MRETQEKQIKEFKMDDHKVLYADLSADHQALVLDYPYPKPYPETPMNVKTIMLGCDPSNRHYKDLKYVFAIGRGGKFSGFLSSFQKNLNAIDLTFETVYSQNLCRNYFRVESGCNPYWDDFAKRWIDSLKRELSIFPENMPILLTSEMLLRVLANRPIRSASDFYSQRIEIPIVKEENKLNRPLIPFYRHPRYILYSGRCNEYRDRVIKIIHG
jgi:hypothetical protein